MSFTTAFQSVIAWEGVYDNDPDDPGGETCFGITRKYEGEWDGWVIVNRLWAGGTPISEWMDHGDLMNCVRGYYLGLWNELRLDEILDADLQATIFGGSINQGKERTVAWLQDALRELGRPIQPDGIMGDKTLLEVKRVIGLGQADGLKSILQLRRVKAYHHTATVRPGSAKFLVGWLNRLFNGA